MHSARFDADAPYGHAAGRTLVIDDLAELDAMRQARLAACLEASRAAEGPRVVAVTALDPAAAGAVPYRPEVEQGMTAVPLPLDLPLREAR